MELASTASTRAARVLLCGVFCLVAYRAATFSITTEEALTFDHLIRPPVRDLLSHYDPANHVLNTLLIKRSVGLLRLSEFSFRLPTLLSAALFLWAAYRVSQRVFKNGPLMLAAVAVLSLNPLVIREFSLARGYGMALAFWMWALDLMLDYLQSGPELRIRNLNLAGLSLGLSVSAHLAFALPALALAVFFLFAAAIKGRLRWAAFTERLVASAVVSAFVLLAIPLSHADASSFSLDVHLGPYRIWPADSGAKSLVQVLRADAQERHVRIGASPALEPILTFYRARYRLANWEPMRHLPLTGDFDYYALQNHDATLVEDRHLRMLYFYFNGESVLLLAQPSHDGTRP